MSKLNIFTKIDEFCSKISHQTSSLMRANDLLELLKTEMRTIEDNYASLFVSGIYDTKKMLAFTDVDQLRYDIKTAMAILEHYVRSDNWEVRVSLISLKSGVDQTKRDKIRDHLKSLVELEEMH